MSILSDLEIIKLSHEPEVPKIMGFEDLKRYDSFKPMISPFVDHQVKTKLVDNGETHHEKIVSYGLSSFGYDLRVGRKFKIFHNALSAIIDPKRFDEKSFIDFEGDVCIIPPNSFVLCASLERIVMPRDVTGVVLGKSTYARTGISCLATPLEAGWEGFVTIELANTTPLPAMVYAEEGVCQVLFFKGTMPCITSYADRGGKYHNQSSGPVTAKV